MNLSPVSCLLNIGSFRIAVFLSVLLMAFRGIFAQDTGLGVLSFDGLSSELLRTGNVFRQKIANARKSPDPVAALESLYRETPNSIEQAELELTLAEVAAIRGDSATVVHWCDQALVRDLPPISAMHAFDLRGSSHDRLGKPKEAMADFVRGFLMCLRFNLPAKYPIPQRKKLQPAPTLSTSPPPTKEARFESRKQNADFSRDHMATLNDQEILEYRYSFGSRIKRIMEREKLNYDHLRSTAEQLTNREDRVQQLLEGVRNIGDRPPWASQEHD